MDLDGTWNPPEEWPDSNPPLPGWVQGNDGRWGPPEEPAPKRHFTRPVADVSNPVVSGTTEAATEPTPEVAHEPAVEAASATPVTPPTQPVPSLGFSDAVAQPRTIETDRIERRRALVAAALAALLAVVLAGGLVVLLVVA